MYSLNGRIKKDTATKVEKKQSRQVLCCNSCGFILRGKSKEFGEELTCPMCQSKDLTYELI